MHLRIRETKTGTSPKDTEDSFKLFRTREKSEKLKDTLEMQLIILHEQGC